MDDIGLELAQLGADGANAALIAGADPADFRHVEAVEPDIGGDFFRRAHGLARAGDHVDFQFGQGSKALQQRFRRGAEPRRWLVVLFKRFPVIGGEQSDLHLRRSSETGWPGPLETGSCGYS